MLSIDLAPTLLSLGGAPLPAKIPGRSLVPLITGDLDYRPRTEFLIEHFSDNVFARVANMGYQAIRTDRWKFIHYRELLNSDELYDLKSDPYELKNLVQEPAAQSTLANLKSELRRLLDQTP